MKSSKLHLSARSGAKEREAISKIFYKFVEIYEGYTADEVVGPANLLEESLRRTTTGFDLAVRSFGPKQ
jgi:hypothetical protein